MKEKEYFQEVDAFELLEESPSPKHADTWAIGNQNDTIQIPYLASRLEKWLISRKFKNSCGPSSTLSKILDTPAVCLEPIYDDNFASSDFKTPEKSSLKNNSVSQPVQSRCNASTVVNNAFDKNIMTEKSSGVGVSDQCCENIEAAVKKLSLGSSLTASAIVDSFTDLLTICGQSAPSKLLDVFSKLWFVLSTDYVNHSCNFFLLNIHIKKCTFMHCCIHIDHTYILTFLLILLYMFG